MVSSTKENVSMWFENAVGMVRDNRHVVGLATCFGGEEFDLMDPFTNNMMRLGTADLHGKLSKFFGPKVELSKGRQRIGLDKFLTDPSLVTSETVVWPFTRERDNERLYLVCKTGEVEMWMVCLPYDKGLFLKEIVKPFVCRLLNLVRGRNG